MPQLSVKTRDGVTHKLSPDGHVSVMEAIRDSGIDELLALCGGSCSCATCHVYVDQASFEALPSMTEDENDLLDSSSFRTGFSRLSCQMRLNPAMENIIVEVAPED